MRDLRINTQTVFYAMYVGEKENADRAGRPTGKRMPVYSKPRMAKAFVSVPSGDIRSNPFGNFANYDKALITVEELKADEYSVFWIDTLPALKDDGSTDTPFDYKVEKKAVWGGQKSFALKKVTENIEITSYLAKLLSEGAISEEEYEEYLKMNEESDED